MAVIDEEWIYEPYGVHIGGGSKFFFFVLFLGVEADVFGWAKLVAWGLCPGRAPGWGSEQVRRLLKWCPEVSFFLSFRFKREKD